MAIQQVVVCFDMVVPVDKAGPEDRRMVQECVEMALSVFLDGYSPGSAYVAQMGDRDGIGRPDFV